VNKSYSPHLTTLVCIAAQGQETFTNDHWASLLSYSDNIQMRYRFNKPQKNCNHKLCISSVSRKA